MKHPAFPICHLSPLLALALLTTQPAHAASVTLENCHAPDPTISLSRLEITRIQQEARLIPAPYANESAHNIAKPCQGAFSLKAVVFSKSFSDSEEPQVTATDRPDVFGSIALPISHTPFDWKWQRVHNARLSPKRGPWASLVRTASRLSGEEKLETVNHWVNTHMRFADDRPGADRWSSARETLMRNRGDCEDFAIAKMKLLEAVGVARSDLYLVIARDLVRQADHALLVVRLNQQLLVLDSSSDQILNSRQVQDYRPIFSYGEAGAWIHGTIQKPAQIASAY